MARVSTVPGAHGLDEVAACGLQPVPKVGLAGQTLTLQSRGLGARLLCSVQNQWREVGPQAHIGTVELTAPAPGA